jgi:hypothetical protein
MGRRRFGRRADALRRSRFDGVAPLGAGAPRKLAFAGAGSLSACWVSAFSCWRVCSFHRKSAENEGGRDRVVGYSGYAGCVGSVGKCDASDRGDFSIAQTLNLLSRFARRTFATCAETADADRAGRRISHRDARCQRASVFRRACVEAMTAAAYAAHLSDLHACGPRAAPRLADWPIVRLIRRIYSPQAALSLPATCLHCCPVTAPLQFQLDRRQLGESFAMATSARTPIQRKRS